MLFVKAKDNNIDTCWSNLVLALVGEMLDPDDIVTGIVCSSRPKMDRIQIWTRSLEVAAVDAVGHRILETIGLEPQDMQTTISLDFQVSGQWGGRRADNSPTARLRSLASTSEFPSLSARRRFRCPCPPVQTPPAARRLSPPRTLFPVGRLPRTHLSLRRRLVRPLVAFLAPVRALVWLEATRSRVR